MISRSTPRLATIAVAVVALVAAACGSDDDSESGTTTPTDTEPAAPSTDTADDESTTVETDPPTTEPPATEPPGEPHAADGTASLLPVEFEPQDLITLDPLLYQAALALGVEPIGTPTFETAAGVGGPLPAYLPADVIADAELFGTILAPNLELIAAATPALVLGTAQFAPPTSESLGGKTEVALFEGSFSDWRAATAFVGDRLDRRDTADALVAEIDARLAGLGDGRTASVIRFTGPDVLPINEAALGGEKLVQAGFALPPELAGLSPQQSLSLEQIELLDTDVIVVVRQDENDTVSGPDQFDDWVASPLWEALPAVQRGDVFVVGPCWATPTAWCAAIVTDDIEEIVR
ncbi:MAG: ABC transporter substrate-binding protein [Actinomycetota bacterium]